MTDREKVIFGLKCLTNEDPYMSRISCHKKKCPYAETETDNCAPAIWRDALELLKAQEPRVLTLEEVKAFDYDYCYLEEERLPGNDYRTVCGRHKVTCITWPSITQLRIVHKDDTYGKTWRCWSSKPTDEQRKAVKWDG